MRFCAASKNALASGDKMTSNIRANLPPGGSLPRSDRFFPCYRTLRNRRAIEEMDVIGQRLKSLGGQFVNDLLDFTAKRSSFHNG
jgi:hypothetical protein